MIPILLAAIVELRLDYTRVSLTKTVRHYTQLVDGIEVPRLSANARCGFAKICRKTGEFADAIGVVVHDPDRDHPPGTSRHSDCAHGFRTAG